MAHKDSFFLPGKKQKENNKKGEKNKSKNEDKVKRQEKFDKNRENLEGTVLNEKQKEKKPFDKKTYRLKKYSNKYKLQQYEEQRKKKILHNYHKTLKNETHGTYKSIAFDEDAVESENKDVGRFVRHPDLFNEDSETKNNQKHKKPTKADHIKKKQEEKLNRQEQIKKAKEEKAEKYAQYKKKKQERFKKLSVKNKKGQPVMALRMEMLLDKLRSETK